MTLAGVSEANVDLVWDRSWNQQMIAPEACEKPGSPPTSRDSGLTASRRIPPEKLHCVKANEVHRNEALECRS
jgi:metal-sulfur cluster biosynthetic enzyme